MNDGTLDKCRGLVEKAGHGSMVEVSAVDLTYLVNVAMIGAMGMVASEAKKIGHHDRSAALCVHMDSRIDVIKEVFAGDEWRADNLFVLPDVVLGVIRRRFASFVVLADDAKADPPAAEPDALLKSEAVVA